MKQNLIHILLIIAILFSYAPFQYLCVKGKQTSVEYSKGAEDGDDDDSQNEEDSIEKKMDDFLVNCLMKAHEHEIEVLTHNSYYYIFGHYYVVQDIFTPPPENV